MHALTLVSCLALLGSPVGAQCDLAQWPADPYAALATLPVAEPVAGGALVTVLDSRERPVVGADVHVVALDGVDPATRSFLGMHFHGRTSAVLASRFGTRYRTGADGTVSVDMPEARECIAISDTWIGSAWPVGEKVVVRLEEHGIIQVEVLDRQGRPVPDVPLWVFNGPLRMGWPLGVGRTEATGRARIIAALRWLRASNDVHVRAAVVAVDPVAVKLPAGYFDRAPELVQLRLPPVGSAELQLDGIEPRLGVPVGTSMAADVARAFGQQPPEAWWPTRQSAAAHFFPLVEVGIDLKVTVEFPEGGGQPAEVTGPGPRGVGERVSLALGLGDTVIVRGRLLHSDGSAFAGGQAAIWCQSNRYWNREFATTSEDGRFRYVLDMVRHHGDAVRLEFRTGPPSPTENLPAAVAYLPASSGGLVDLGDLVLAPQPLLLGGRVLDGEGAPVPDVVLHLRSELPGSSQLPGCTATSDGEGRFRFFRSEPGKRSFTLVADSTEWRQAGSAVGSSGDEDMVVRVARLGRLELQLRQAMAGNSGALSCTLTAPGGTVSNGQRRDQRFVFERLFAGRYDLSLQLLNRELARFDGLEVTPGSCDDPRLIDFDWHRLVEFAQVRVIAVQESSRPPTIEVVASGSDRGPRWFEVQCDHTGFAAVPFVAGLRLFATAETYRSVELHPAGAPIETTLRPRAHLRLQVPEGLKLTPGLVVAYDTPSGRRQELPLRPARGDWIVRPDGDGVVTLRLEIRDERMLWRTLTSQEVALRIDEEILDVPLDVDEGILEDAERIAEAVRKLIRR